MFLSWVFFKEIIISSLTCDFRIRVHIYLCFMDCTYDVARARAYEMCMYVFCATFVFTNAATACKYLFFLFEGLPYM